MKLGVLDRDGLRRFLLRAQGTGYASDEDSVRYKELDAWADIAAKVAESLEAAFGGMFLSTAAGAALDALELARFLVQGSSLSDATRQARLLAFARALPKLVPARLANAFAQYLGATSGTTLSPTLAQLQAHRASPLAALLVNRREPSATSELQRRDLAPIVARGLPGRNIFAGISTKDAAWGDALDPASIKLEPAVTIPPQTKARVGPIEIHPGSIVTREQWIELQSQLCWKSRGFSIDQAKQGRTIFVQATLATAATTTDTSIDWSNRLLQVWGVVDDAAVTDPTTLTDDEHCWMAPSKLGPAGAGYTHTLQTTAQASTGITFHVNGSGDLVVTNTTGGTRHLVLFVRCSPTYTAGSTTDTQPWMNAESIEHDDVAELYAAQVVSEVGDPGQFAGEDAGAVRRVMYSGPLFVEADAGIPQGVVLDTSEDWRNRWVLVVPLQNFGSGPSANYPVINSYGMITPPFAYVPSIAPRLFFTGAGQAMGNPAVLANQHQCSNFFDGSLGGESNVWLFARSVDGALVLEMKDGTSGSDVCTSLIMVIATEQTTGASVVTPVPVHATQVQSIDLEQPQNVGCYAQGRQGGAPRYLLTDPDPKARPTCPPMGRISDGNMPVRPAKWERREMLGSIADGTWELRQPIEFQRRRLVSVHVPAGQTVELDLFNAADQLAPGVTDQFDARDRMVWIEGRFATSDITIGDASQASDTAATQFFAVLYSGPAASANNAAILVLFALSVGYVHSRNAAGQGLHSRLVLQNQGGADYWVNAVVECTGYLGFADRRNPGYAV